MHPPAHNSKGTVSLVALCFVAVLGIVLGSYLALCSRSMNLSNRSFQSSLSQQLAEFGLEEGLRAFNKYDWGSWSSSPTNVTVGTWTLDTTNHRASRTISFAAGKLGQGVTATVKIRIDNYDAAQLNSNWITAATYRVNDLVGDAGLWYRCIKAHTSSSSNRPVNYNYWVPEGLPCAWDLSTGYQVGDLIVYNEIWYRCKTANTNRPPPSNSSYWQALVAIYTSPPAWPYVSSGQEALVFYGNSIVQLTNSTWNSSSPSPYTWLWQDSQPYTYNDVVYYSGIWYRCLSSHTSSWYPNSTSNTSLWSRVESIWAWSSALNYHPGDTVYFSSGSKWYRCLRANLNQTPSDTSSYWSNAPLYSPAWDNGRSYSQNDQVRYNGVWYLSVANSNAGQNPSTASGYWVPTTTTSSSYIWNNTTSYAVGAFRCYDGVWYKCVTAHSNHTPNETAYWTATWTNSFGVTTGAPVAYVEGAVLFGDGSSTRAQLRADLAPAPLFPNAAAATGDLTITTSTGLVDSYDYSLGTTYSAQATAGSTNYSAVLAAGSTLAINGTTAVRGYLAWPSPPSGISTGTTVWGQSSPASPKVDTTHVSRSPYVPKFDTWPAPNLTSAFTSANFPQGVALETIAGGTVSIGTPGATTPSRYYFNGNLQLASSTSYNLATLNINGPVILFINGYLRLRTGGGININSSGSAEIHLASRIRVDTGSNGIVNRAPSSTNPNPKNLFVICDGSSTSTQYYDDTSGPLYGLIYVPNTTATSGLTIGTSGTGVIVYGAISASELTFSNEATVHYDTSLRYASLSGVDQPYAITEWRILPVTEQATMP